MQPWSKHPRPRRSGLSLLVQPPDSQLLLPEGPSWEHPDLDRLWYSVLLLSVILKHTCQTTLAKLSWSWRPFIGKMCSLLQTWLYCEKTERPCSTTPRDHLRKSQHSGTPRWQGEWYPPSKGLRVSGLGSRVCVAMLAAEKRRAAVGFLGCCGFLFKVFLKACRAFHDYHGSLGVYVICARVGTSCLRLGDSHPPIQKPDA